MGFRFRRSIRLGKFAKINLGKTGASLSVGVRGAHVTIGKNGVRKTVGIPGTGISYTDYERYDKNNKEISDINTEQTEVKLIDKMNNYIETNKNVKRFCPIWLSNWMMISFIMCALGIIGCFTNGFIILFLPLGFVSLLVSLIIFIVKWRGSLRA